MTGLDQDSSERLKIDYWPLERLIPFARNARTHSPSQVAEIAGSIRTFGFSNPILVGPQGDVVAGHGRLAAATSYHLLVGRHPAEGPLGPRICLQARRKVRRSIRGISAWAFMSVIRSGADPSPIEPIEWSYPLCANG
jgi:ParB-like nuclease domain